jgi:hypothetical protein
MKSTQKVSTLTSTGLEEVEISPLPPTMHRNAHWSGQLGLKDGVVYVEKRSHTATSIVAVSREARKFRSSCS